MIWSDEGPRRAAFTLYFYPAGTNLEGEPLYQLQDYCKVDLQDVTSADRTFWMPLPWYHPLGDPMDHQVRFKLEMVSGAVSSPQPGDTDVKTIHFVGPF